MIDLLEYVHHYKFQYHLVGKFGGGNFGKFGKSSMIRQTKIIQISTYN